MANCQIVYKGKIYQSEEDFLSHIKLHPEEFPKKITFLRHGITEEDEKNFNSGQNDIPLSEKGREETLQTAKEIKEKGITTIYTSPTKRAKETGDIIQANSDANLIEVEGIKPWDLGSFSSKPEKDFDERYYVENPNVQVPGGESFNEFKDRFSNTINELRKVSDKNTAILTHSKGLDIIKAFESSRGKWDKKAIDAYFAKGIDDRGTKQTWELNTWYVPKEVSEDTLKEKLTKFIESVGGNIKLVDSIKDSVTGEPLDYNAKTDLLSRTIEYIQDKADVTTLPEEASHLYVSLLPENSSLKKEMLDNITSYGIYKDTFEQYRGDKNYRNPDGSINIPKIKEEAIAKVLSHYIIDQQDGTSTGDSLQKIEKAKNWWQRIASYLKTLFSKVKGNPFKEGAEDIYKGDISQLELDKDLMGTYAQKGKKTQPIDTEGSLNKLQEDQDKITLDTTRDEKGDRRHDYYYSGKKAAGSVTQLIVDKGKRVYEKSEAQEKYSMAMADHGEKAHKDLENLISSYLTPEHTIAPKPREITEPKNSPGPVYSKLQKFAEQIIDHYRNQQGVKIYTELKIFDPNYYDKTSKERGIGGSIDFLAVRPDGSYDKLDWKFKGNLSKKTDESLDRSTLDYKKQSNEYARILKDVYGLEDRRRDWMFPVEMLGNATKNSKGEVDGFNLQDIDITPLDLKQLPSEKDYLLPIVISDKLPDDQRLDEYLGKLDNVLEQIKLKKGNDFILQGQVKTLKKAINDIRFRQDLTKFAEFGKNYMRLVNHFINDDSMNDVDSREMESILTDIFAPSSAYMANILSEIQKQIKAPGIEPIEKERLEKQLAETQALSSRASYVLLNLKDYRMRFFEKMANMIGEGNVDQLEAALSFLQKTFTDPSLLPTKSIKVITALHNEAVQQANLRTRENNEKLIEIKNKLEKEFGKNALDIYKEHLLDFNEKTKRASLTNQYSEEYWKQREDALREAHKTRTPLWFRENTTFDKEAYQKDFNEVKDRLEKALKFSGLSGEEFEAQKKADIEELKRFEKERNPGDKMTNLEAILRGGYGSKYLVGKDKWHSEKYQQILKSPALKEAYNTFMSINEQMQEEGLIEGISKYKFLPGVEVTREEARVQGQAKKGFLQEKYDRLSVPEGLVTKQVPMNLITGNEYREIPISYNNIVEDPQRQNLDLGVIYAKAAESLYKYQALSGIENSLLNIVEAERSKKIANTSKFGKVVKGEAPNTNVETLETFVNYYLYGKTPANDKAIQLPNALAKLMGIDNKNPLSLIKLVEGLVRYNGIRLLALSPRSVASNIVGGTGNIHFLAKGRMYFTDKQWYKGIAMAAGNDKKFYAVMDYFDPHMESEKGKEQLSEISSMDRLQKMLQPGKIADAAMIGFKYTDNAVQNIAIASRLQSLMIHDGKLVDIRTHLLSTPEFAVSKDFKEGEYDRAKLDKAVEQMGEEKSLLATAKLDDKGKPYWEDDKGNKIDLSKPGQNEIKSLRTEVRDNILHISRRVLGNMGTEDKSAIRLTFLGMTLFQFRNWVPRLVQSKYGGIHYDPATQTENYGSWRYFLKNIFSSNVLPTLETLYRAYGGGQASPSIREAAREGYEKMKLDAAEHGKEFNMSEAEYLDKHITWIRTAGREFLLIAGLASLIAMMRPDKDEELTPDEKSQRAYLTRATRKFYNEFSAFIDIRELEQLMGNSIPAVGLLTDMRKFFGSAIGESYSYLTNDEEGMKRYHTAKSFFKLMPLGNQAMEVGAMLSNEFKKEWGINLNPVTF